jgi:biopolymer transport protein ExbD
MQWFSSRPHRIVTINLMPLIDVMLVLIIFLVLTTTFIVAPGIKVDLPSGRSAERASDNDVIVVIQQDGVVYYRDERVELPTLHAILSQAKQQQPGLRLVIRADKNVQHGRVVEVMDTAKAVGIERLAIATTPKSMPQQ